MAILLQLTVLVYVSVNKIRMYLGNVSKPEPEFKLETFL